MAYQGHGHDQAIAEPAHRGPRRSFIIPDKLVEFALFARKQAQPIVQLEVALNTKGGVQT